MHTHREYLVHRIAIFDNLLEHLQTDAVGDHDEFKNAIESLRADDVTRLNDLVDAEGAI
jgi:hypothetical protein